MFKDIEFMDRRGIFGSNYGNTFERIFCEFSIGNMFYRKDSKFKSYRTVRGDQINSENIPVYSFRYILAFNFTEKEEYEGKITKKHDKA